MSAEIPVCKDCIYLLGVRRNPENAVAWKCQHPSNIHTKVDDPVNGAPVYAYHNATCYDARKTTGLCQPQGVLFQPYEQPSSEDFRKPAKDLPTAEQLLGELGL